MLLPKLAFTSLALAVLCLSPASGISSAGCAAPALCDGCQMTFVASSNTPSTNWSFTLVIAAPGGGSSHGQCLQHPTNPDACAPQACVVYGLALVNGPVSSSYSWCRQTGVSPTYCQTPPPTTNGAGTGSSDDTYRCGCGNNFTFSCSAVDQETAETASASATVNCSPCLP